MYYFMCQSEIAKKHSDYLEAVEQLARDKVDWIFPNSSDEHAAIVISNIFRYSKDIVRIYDDTLNGDLTADFDSYFVEGMDHFFEQNAPTGGRVELLIRDKVEPESELYKRMMFYKGKFGGVELRKASSEVVDAFNSVLQADANFVLGDNCSYRLERLDKVSAAKEVRRKAICNFNGPDNIRPLIKIFDQYFSKCGQFTV